MTVSPAFIDSKGGWLFAYPLLWISAHPADMAVGLLPVRVRTAGWVGFLADAVSVAESLAPAAAGV